MSKVIKLVPKEHIYNLDNCAGCKEEIKKDEIYHEITSPNYDNTEVKHIALCEECYELSKSYGVFS